MRDISLSHHLSHTPSLTSSYFYLYPPMDFFTNSIAAIFSEPETEALPTIPVDSDSHGNGGGGCTIS